MTRIDPTPVAGAAAAAPATGEGADRKARQSPRAGKRGTGSRRGRSANYFWFVAPAVLVLVALTLLPGLATIGLSFTSLDIATLDLSFAGLANYERLITDPQVLNAIGVSVVFMTVPVALQMIIGLIVALVLHEKLPGTGWIRAVFLAPMLLPTILMGLMWRTLFDPNLGGVNYFLELVGIPNIPWFTNEIAALSAIVVTAVWGWTPFVALMLLSGLQQVPKELREAAVVDGASWFHWARLIAVPLLWPVARIVIVFRVMEALAIFPIIFVLTNGGPAGSTETINFYAYRSAFGYFQFPYAAALIVVFLIMVLLITLPTVANMLKRRER